MLLKEIPNLRMYSVDLDPILIELNRVKLQDYIANKRLIVECKNYSLFDEEEPFEVPTLYDFIFVDLGMSNYHLLDNERGFSIDAKGALDIRYRYMNSKYPMAKDIVLL